jgi:hypothetical protein
MSFGKGSVVSKIVILAFICFTFLFGTSEANSVGEIGLFADINGTECVVQDDTPSVVEVHIIVTGITGYMSIQFAAPKPDCWLGTSWLGDAISFETVIGNTQDILGSGLSIGTASIYNCIDGGAPSPLYLGKMSYLT